MFKKNLDTIRIKNSKLADRLEKIDINSIIGIEVFESESKDLIISYKNTTLHSPIDPVRESKTTWNRTIKNNLKKNDIQIVFGLGLGYLFKRAYVNSESKIFIIEPFIEVLRFVLEHVDFSNELSDERVYITDNVGDIYDKLQKEYLSNDRVEFLFLNQYALVNQELLQDLTSKTFEIVEGRGNDENTILKFSWLWTENFIRNFVHFSEARPLGFFEGKFADKTALIIAAGSSLADDLEKIKENQDKFVTIAVGRAFNSLVNNGVIPDFTVFADAQNCLDQIKGLENFIEKTNLILLAKTDQDLYKLKSKTKIIYFSETDSITRLFKDVCPENAGFYKSGSSVSILSYYIAKALGFGQIAFSGLDLAFIDNKIFADGQTIENVAEEIKHKIIHVKDKEGNDLITRTDYAWFIRQFNEIFSEELNLATVINTSLKGAFINGMEYMAFSEFAETLSAAKPDIDNITSAVFTETKEGWNSALTNVFSKIGLAYKELDQISPDLSELFNEFAKICTELSELGKTDYDPEAYILLNNKAAETRKRVVNNLFLSNYIQSQTWNYTKNYVTKTLPNKEDVINNLELDKYFFNSADCANTKLIKILKETLNTLEETPGLAIK
ncbi:MAG: 6-hydroxymethylpterin diphosphokinase MptE-like protein [bacterium]